MSTDASRIAHEGRSPSTRRRTWRDELQSIGDRILLMILRKLDELDRQDWTPALALLGFVTMVLLLSVGRGR